jgi:hypothetical protein
MSHGNTALSLATEATFALPAAVAFLAPTRGGTLPRDEAGPRAAPVTPWWRQAVGAQSAAGVIGAALLGSSAAIEIARAWTSAPRVAAEASHALGGLLVALFVVAAIGLGLRARAVGGVVVGAAFALVAHGATLALQGELVGALFLGVAPVAALLAHVAFLQADAAGTGDEQ